MSGGARRALWNAVVLTACAAAGPIHAKPLAPLTAGAPGGRPWSSYGIHADLQPGRPRLGERALYHAWVVVPRDEAVRWIAPQSGGAFTWGSPAARRIHAYPSDGSSAMMQLDTVRVEIPLQIFALGQVTIPGVTARLPYLLPHDRESIRPMPTLGVFVTPVLTAADSNADLRPLRGPLAAPWWERVRWSIVLAGLVGLAVLVLLVKWSRRRRTRPVPATPPPAHDPVAEALAEIAALRRLDLPAHGRFNDHAFHLTRILRRFLEATRAATFPGDTTTELLRNLERASQGAVDLSRLEQLLRGWDRVKFARVPSSLEEARRAENDAESMVRRGAQPAPRQVA